MKPTTAYLLAYNVVQCLGWTFILVKLLSAVTSGTPITAVYDVVSCPVQIFQTLMFMEVVHAALRLVRSPVMTALMQISSRLIIIWPVAYNAASCHNSIGVAMYLFAWSVTEVIRYSYYAFGLLDMQPFFLTWARYSFFVVLYPLGALGEIITAYAALPQIHKEKILSVDMPNRGNMAFSFYHALTLFLLGYIPFFPQLYFYMFAQRKKVFARAQDTKKTE